MIIHKEFKNNQIIVNIIEEGETMKTNELKKGDRVLLHCGWYATIFDNMRGNTRLANVEGLYTEIGSIYVWDIKYHINKEGSIIPIELTPKQIKDRDRVKAMGF